MSFDASGEETLLRANGGDGGRIRGDFGANCVNAISEDGELGLPNERAGSSSVQKVVFQFTNCVVGSGILALSYSLQQAGVVTGLLILLWIVFLTDITVRSLVACGAHEGVRNYEELMDKLFGTKGYVAVSLLLFLYDFGAMVSYLIILTDASASVVRVICTNLVGLDDDFGILSEEWPLRRICLSAISICMILPLVMHRDIAALESISKYSVFSTLLLIGVMMFAVSTGDTCPLRDTEPKTCPDTSNSWLTIVGENPSTAFGIIAFGFVSHDTAFMLRNSLNDTSKWGRTTDLALLLSMGMCLLIALPGYIGFRDTIQENILNNFAADDSKIVCVRILLILSMVATYPMCFFIARHILNELINRWQARGDSSRMRGTPAGLSIHHVSRQRHLSITFALFASSVAIGLFVKDLGFVMSLTGNVSGVSVAFILPPLCSIKSNWNHFKSQRYRDGDSVSMETGSSGGSAENLIGVGGTPARGFCRENIIHMAICAFGLFALLFCTAQTLHAKSK